MPQVNYNPRDFMTRPGDAIASISASLANTIAAMPKILRENEQWKAFEASNKDAKSANEKLLKGAQSILARLGVDPNTAPKYQTKSDGSVESTTEYATRMSQFLLPVATSEKLGGIENFKKSMTALGLASTPSVSERVGQLTMAEQLKTQYPTPDVLAQDAAAGGFNLNPQGPVTTPGTMAPEPTHDQAVPPGFTNPQAAQPAVPPGHVFDYPAGGQAGPPDLIPSSSPVKFETPTDYMSAMQPMIQRGLQRGTMSEKDASDIMAEALKLDTTLKIKQLEKEKAELLALKQSAGELSGRMLSAGGKAYKKGTNEEVTRIDPMAAVQSEYDVEGGRFPTYSYSYGYGGGAKDDMTKLQDFLIKKMNLTKELQYTTDLNDNTIAKPKPNTRAYAVLNNPKLFAVYAWIYNSELAAKANVKRPPQSEIDQVMQDISQSELPQAESAGAAGSGY